MVELAVIPTRAIRLLQPQDGISWSRANALHLAHGTGSRSAPATPARDRLTEMPRQKPHHLPANLQARHIRVQIQPVDALDLERHMTLEHVVDVRHARHPRSMERKGRLCRPDLSPPREGAGGGARPPPANTRPHISRRD